MANANYGSNAWYRRKLEVGKAFCEDLLSEKVTSMDEYILQTTEEMQKPYSRGVSIGVGVFLYMETLCVIKKRRIVDKLFATPKMSKVRLFSVAFDIAAKFDRYKSMSNEDISNIISVIGTLFIEAGGLLAHLVWHKKPSMINGGKIKNWYTNCPCANFLFVLCMV